MRVSLVHLFTVLRAYRSQSLQILVLLTIIGLSLISNPALAVSRYTTDFNQTYGTNGSFGGTTVGSCVSCHPGLDGSGGMNRYGTDWRAFGQNFNAIEALDSDQDGYSNIDEINAGTQPGDPNDMPSGGTNTPPTADAGVDQTVAEGSLVTLDGSASSDPDDGIATYSWSQTSGTQVTLSDAAAVNPTFTAPVVPAAGETLTFSLTVSDVSGQTDSATVFVDVTKNSQPPVANAGPDQTVAEGVTVTLDGSNSSDPNGDISTYLWEQTGGPSVALSDTGAIRPTFTSPAVQAGGATLTFRLTVTDQANAQSTDTTIVTVSFNNAPPTADASTDQTVTEGSVVNLDGTGSSDSDGTIATYQWSQTAGATVTLTGADSAQPSFTAPDVGPNGSALTFELTVTDDGGISATDSVIVNVTWTNAAPSANAGGNQSSEEGSTVTLNASGSSDPDDGIASYVWTQTSGTPSVTLSNPTGTQTTFVAPTVDGAGAILNFQLTVADNGGLQSTANVTVTVTDNGISGYPADAITTTTTTGNTIGLESDSGGTLTQLEPVDPTTLPAGTDKPQDFVFGMLDLQMKTVAIGATAVVTVHLETPAPDDYSWYKYNPTTGQWTDYATVTGPGGVIGAVFNATRDQVTLTLIDGGMGDDDGQANGIIQDPSGVAAASAIGSTGSNSFGSSGGGCFITTIDKAGAPLGWLIILWLVAMTAAGRILRPRS